MTVPVPLDRMGLDGGPPAASPPVYPLGSHVFVGGRVQAFGIVGNVRREPGGAIVYAVLFHDGSSCCALSSVTHDISPWNGVRPWPLAPGGRA